MSVSDRLGRLLFIVPYVVHRDGVPITELAQVLGVSVSQIEADINLLSMVGQPPLTPDHLVDLYVEDNIVYVQLDQSLTRPLRLTHDEARALVLGAKLVGHLGGWGDDLETLLARIVQHLHPVDRQVVQNLSERVLVQPGQEPASQAKALRQAVQECRIARVDYYSASSDRHKRYNLKPLGLMTHGGIDYVVARDIDAADHEKIFRLDRVGQVELTADLFEPPSDVDLEKFRTQRLYSGADALHAKVRFASHLSRDIRERFAAADIVTADAPGAGLEVQVATSSAAWLTRWALAFGTDAEVRGPPPCREHIRAVCEEAMAAYQREPSYDETPRGLPVGAHPQLSQADNAVV